MTLSWRASGSEKIPFRPYIVAINEIHFYRIGRGPRRDPVLVESIELASTTRVDSKEIINRREDGSSKNNLKLYKSGDNR